MMSHLFLICSEIQKLEKEKEGIRIEANKTRDELMSARGTSHDNTLIVFIVYCMHDLWLIKC